jgi:hypothetical protein
MKQTAKKYSTHDLPPPQRSNAGGMRENRFGDCFPDPHSQKGLLFTGMAVSGAIFGGFAIPRSFCARSLSYVSADGFGDRRCMRTGLAHAAGTIRG